MKRKYIAPKLEIAMIDGEYVCASGGVNTGSKGVDLGDLGAKERNSFDFDIEDDDEY